MSLSPAALDAMLAIGMTAEQVVAVVKAELAAEAAEAEAKRARTREAATLRQQRKRARDRGEGGDEGDDVSRMSRVTAVTERDGRDAAGPLDGPPERTDQNPPLIPHHIDGDARALDLAPIGECILLAAKAAIAEAKRVQKARYHRLPADWEPPVILPDKLASKVAQWPPGKLEDEADAFRAWAANAKDENGKGRKLDWDQAFHNWLRSKHDEWSRHPQSRGAGNVHPLPRRAGGFDTRSSVAAGAALLERIHSAGGG